MIITCPQCATGHDVPAEMLHAGAAVIDCSRCGHRWLESRALSGSAADGARAAPRQEEAATTSATAEDAASQAARAMAAAAWAREKARRERQGHRRRELRRFAALALFLAATGGALFAFSDVVVGHAPGAARLYALAGIRTQPLAVEHLSATRVKMASGKAMLAVRGEIVNRSGWSHHAPTLAFTLVDEKGRALHAWRLPAASGKPLPGGRRARFTTRIAAPPPGASRVIVRLARES